MSEEVGEQDVGVYHDDVYGDGGVGDPDKMPPVPEVQYWVGRPLVLKVLCKLFVESSTCPWVILQLPCFPTKQGELLENILP